MSHQPGGGEGVSNHGQLSGTSAADSHPIAAITGLQAALDGKSATHSHPYEASGAVAAHEAASDPHAQYTTGAEAAAAAPVQSVAGKTGTVTLVKADAGLGNVDNTSDAAKPVSTATQTALDLKAPLASPAFTGTPTGITKAHVGLGSVDNTSDAAKPISTATQTALDAKAASIHNHDAAYEAIGAVAAHAAAADPHTGYQKESEKGQANGYASLGAGGLVPIAQIASGTPTGAKFVRDDGTLAAPTAEAAVTLTTVEVSLGSAPDARRSGSFTITGAGLTIGKAVLIQQASGPYTGKGAREDEAEMDPVSVTGKVLDATTIRCYWNSPNRVRGNYKFNYLVSA